MQVTQINKIDKNQENFLRENNIFECPHCHKSSKIFEGIGGDSESKRLEVPLLGNIPLSPEIVKSADNGNPYVLNFKDSPITMEFNKISEQIIEISNLN